MNDKEKLYYELIGLILETGTKMPKKHGEYVVVKLYDGFSIVLDTWNKSINTYKDGVLQKNLGLDWGGGFRCHVGLVRFWIAHIKLQKKT